MSNVAIALLAVAAAVCVLAGAVLLAAWWHLGRTWHDTLDDRRAWEQQAAQNGRPLVGATILKFAAENAKPRLEDDA